MQEPADKELLWQYAHRNSEEAFAMLVARHVNMVYSAALRKTGNPHAAEEITQAVFVILARKADRLAGGTIVSGWLYQTTRLTSSSYLRTEIRRARREQEAFMQSQSHETEAELWPRIAPLLEDAMSGLSQKERNAIALRFFEGRSFQEIGTTVGASENAAKKRVGHALEKLRKYFLKRGVVSTAAIIAGAVSAHSVQAAPVALASTASAMAMAKGAAASGSTLTLIKGALKVMAWSKAKTAVAVGAATLLVAGTTTIAVRQFTSPSIEDFFTHKDSAYLRNAPPVFILRPSRYPESNFATGGGPAAPGKFMARGRPFVWLLCDAYGFIPQRMVLPPDLPAGKFDFLLTQPGDPKAGLREEIKKRFGVTAHPEVRETDVLILKAAHFPSPGLRTSKGAEPGVFSDPGKFRVSNFKMSDAAGAPGIADCLGFLLGIPVIDETGLTGAYDFEVTWPGGFDVAGSSEQRKQVEHALLDQLGLELSPGRKSLEVLVVEKTK